MPIIIIMILSATTGVIMWLISTELLVGYIIGIVLGITLTILVLRVLGKKAKRSLIASTLFHNITRYKATIYHIHGQQAQSATATVYNDANDFANLVDILKNQMRFQSNTAKEAAQHAMDTAADKPIEDKIRAALIYLDSGKRENMSASA